MRKNPAIDCDWLRSLAISSILALLAACGRPPAPPPPEPPAKSAAAPAPAAPLPPGTLPTDVMHAWSIYDDQKGKTYTVGDVTIAADALQGGQGISVTVTAPGMAPYRLKDDEVYATLRFGVGKLDPAQPRQVALLTYTGGAHCCTQWTVLTPKGKEWKASVLGQWDGDGFDWPKDVDGDGTPDLVMVDQSFLYAFGGYAQSRPPPEVFHVSDGKLVDVTTRPSFRPLFERDMAEVEPDCRKGDQPACAAYAADASRLGRRAEAWKLVMAARSEPDWLPEGCKVKRLKDGMCPEGQELKHPDFPTALAAFLDERGYR